MKKKKNSSVNTKNITVCANSGCAWNEISVCTSDVGSCYAFIKKLTLKV